MNTAHVYAAPAPAGRGLAGQCPARAHAKTPAARKQASHVVDGGRMTPRTSVCARVCGEEVA